MKRPLLDTDRRLRPDKRPEGYNKGWTPEEDALLTRMWPHNFASFIAARLGRTRNSVIGRAGRLFLVKAPREPWFSWTGRFPALDRYIAYRAFAKPPDSVLCGTIGCRNTRQPGRDHCAECHRPAARKRGWTGMGRASGSSSLW